LEEKKTMHSQQKIGLGFTGASGSGKSTLAKLTVRVLVLLGVFADEQIASVMLDWFYSCLAHLPLEERAKTNFDEPAALEHELIAEMLETIIVHGKDFVAPGYRFCDQTRLHRVNLIRSDVSMLVFDGIFLLVWPNVVAQLQITIAVVADHDVRLTRRILRDKAVRGIDEATTRKMWDEYVEPGNRRYIEPHVSKADLIVENNNGQLPRALRETVKFVLEKLGISVDEVSRESAIARALAEEQRKLIF